MANEVETLSDEVEVLSDDSSGSNDVLAGSKESLVAEAQTPVLSWGSQWWEEIRDAPRVLTVFTALSLVASVGALVLAFDAYVRVDSLETTTASRVATPALEASPVPEPEPEPEPGPVVATPAVAPKAPPPAPDPEPARLGQSIGSPRNGALRDATTLPEGPGYVLRHPDRVFGTKGTVRHLLAVIERSRAEFPRVHRLAIGDLSNEYGGPLTGHRSHQSGRDVDIGFYFRKRPRRYPGQFVRPKGNNLHLRAMWDLVEAMADTADQPEGVAWVLLDYRVQKMLHMHATRVGVPKETIERLLQYPRGKTAEVGLVRHFPGHEDHFHVRFRCSVSDPSCKSGIGPFDGLDVEFPSDAVESVASAPPPAPDPSALGG